MRADRLLSMLLLLQAHGRLTSRELARRLEVSERTVHRDMEALSAARVPVLALRGSRGGWQLDEGWRTQVPGLDEAELRALLMAQPRVIGDPRLAAAADRAMGKLLAALPASLREQAASIRQRLYVDSSDWRGTVEDVSLLPIVQDAVARDRKLKIRYRKAGKEVSERMVDPLGLVAKGSVWYLVAHTSQGFRTFRVSRIEEATVLDRPSKRPRDFNLAEQWHSSTNEFRKGWTRVEVTLRAEPGVAREILTWRNAKTLTRSDEEGWITLRLGFETEGQARFVVLGFGPRIEVLEPAGLKEQVAADVAAMMRRIRGSAQPANPPFDL